MFNYILNLNFCTISRYVMNAMHIKIIRKVRLEALLTSYNNLARVAGVLAEGERRVPGAESGVELQNHGLGSLDNVDVWL